MRTWIAISLIGLAACTEPDAPSVDDSPAYLALGDSIAFGYDPLTDPRTHTGYPELLGERLGLAVTNAACPGEATGGFLSPVGNDNHCRENKQAYPLHVEYEGHQLKFAIEFLRDHPGTELVTLDLGGNDASKLNDICHADPVCIAAGFVPMLEQYGKNLDLIFEELRKVYDGRFIALGIYNPVPNDQVFEWGLQRINGILAEKAARWDIDFADGGAAFDARSADPCKDGLLIGMPGGVCDVHPSPEGDRLLADTVQAVLP
jgi:lysophospholipase L1-like esterase